MTNAPFESLAEYRDPATVQRVERALETGSIELFEEVKQAVNYWSRDNARTPMQWTDDENAGFTTGEPWIKVNPNYAEINAARARERDDSVWRYYRRLVELRADEPALVYGSYEPLLADYDEVFAYRRTLEDEQVLVLLNFFDGTPTFVRPEHLRAPEPELLVGNYPVETDVIPEEPTLRPYEARVYRLVR